MTTFFNKLRFNRGVALVLLLFVMLILLIVTLSLASIAATDNQIALRNLYNKQAFNLARSGLIRAMAEVKSNPNVSLLEHTMPSGGSYTVTVNFVQSADGRGYWRVTSVGKLGDARYSRTLTSWLEPESFSKYIYITKQERASGSSQTIWFTDNDVLKGPVHTNGYFSIYSRPKFTTRVTSSNNNDSFYNPVTRVYTQGGTYTDPTKFYHYYTSYAQDAPSSLDPGNPKYDFSFSGGQGEKKIPAITEDVENKPGVNVITGDLDYMRFEYDSTKQLGVVKYKKTGSSIVYTVDITTDQTYYVKGNINDMYGTVQGNLTVFSTGNIKISNDLKYTRDSFGRPKGMLGIVAENDIIVNTSSSVVKDITLEAAIMSNTGSFYVNDYNKGVDRGVIRIYGSLSQTSRGPVGTFTTNGIYTGYHKKDYEFDERLAYLYPPNFPNTGVILVKSFRDKAALGGI